MHPDIVVPLGAFAVGIVAILAGAFNRVRGEKLRADQRMAMVALRGRWFIELAEAMSLLRAEHATSKAFFTSPTDDYRPPYGMHNVQVKRQCVFFATINPEGGYLRDPTGGRRYWPIACGEVAPSTLLQSWPTVISSGPKP